MESRPAREYEFELTVGYVDADGRLHKKVILRKMTGNEEALLADKKLRQNGGKLVTELLTSCLRQIGDIKPVSRQIVANLTSADRNYLLLELRKITFGAELEASYSCSACGTSMSMTQDLNAMPVRRLDGESIPQITVELLDGWEDKTGAVYNTAVFRLPNGDDEEKIANIMKENTSRGMNALLTRCLLSLGDLPTERREAIGSKIISDLTMGDRARIEKAFRQKMPGVDLALQIECDSCSRKFTTTLDLTSFFSPG